MDDGVCSLWSKWLMHYHSALILHGRAIKRETHRPSWKFGHECVRDVFKGYWPLLTRDIIGVLVFSSGALAATTRTWCTHCTPMATAPECGGTFSRWARISWTRKCTALWNTSSTWLCLSPWRPCTNTGRPHGKGNPTWRLVCACYIFGKQETNWATKENTN